MKIETRVELFPDRTFSFSQDRTTVTSSGKKIRNIFTSVSREDGHAWRINSGSHKELKLDGFFARDGKCDMERTTRSYPFDVFVKERDSFEQRRRHRFAQKTRRDQRLTPAVRKAKMIDGGSDREIISMLLSGGDIESDSGSALKKMIRDGTNKALMHSLGLDRKTSRGR